MTNTSQCYCDFAASGLRNISFCRSAVLQVAVRTANVGQHFRESRCKDKHFWGYPDVTCSLKMLSAATIIHCFHEAGIVPQDGNEIETDSDIDMVKI
jgi:hypothetical protein